ncbi:phosphatidylserine lipase ABHD16A [Passer montanus]|uniref:phosphatidylserine lipase ABHD16A n=1 Tax=Passer montanus TaxID=9160 RepID=UPI0019610F28|nr:phosphatidylserine lipase ABHD16A [Passer montanus]
MSRVVPLSHCAATLGLLLAGVACLRGLGRWSNPQYVEFMAVLEESHRSGSPESKAAPGSHPGPPDAVPGLRAAAAASAAARPAPGAGSPR